MNLTTTNRPSETIQEPPVPVTDEASRDAGSSRHAAASGERRPPMEILDFLAIARRRWLVLVGVPVLAAVITLGYLLLTPTVWTATATVNAPALVGGQFGTQYTGSQAVNQFVAQFQAVAVGPSIAKQVSDKTSVPSGRIKNGLTVGQVGASSVMTIMYVDSKKADVAPVVTNVATDTLKVLFDQQVTLAEAQVTATGKSVDDADAAISAWEAKSGVVSPDDVYRGKLTQLGNLQQQQISMQANGNAAGVAAVKAQIASLQTSLKTFGPLLAEYRSLTTTRDAAAASLTNAKQQVELARAQASAADPAQVVYIGGVHDAGKSDEVISKLLPITAAGVFLGVILVAILEMLAASRRRNAVRQPSAASTTTSAG